MLTQRIPASSRSAGAQGRCSSLVPSCVPFVRRSSSPFTAGHANARSRPFATRARTVDDDDVIIPEPSYSVPLGLLAVSGFSIYEHITPLALITGILGVFLTIQATRIKFRFGPEALEVVVGDKEKDTSNAFVGGPNCWYYDTFTNWEFWWPNFPVLVYFKETQTKPEGQIHFFPVIFNGKQLYDVMVERCGETQNSGPK